MDYSFDSHSSRPYGNQHDSLLSPSSHDVYGYSRNSRSSTRLVVPNSTSTHRNKSVNERERRPYHHESEHRARSSVRREEADSALPRRERSTRRRRSWPPQPTVEDEDVALAKEFPRRRSPKELADEVCMPGTMDQTPVLIELENHDQRFVLLPHDEVKAESSQAHQRRQRREKQPSLRVDVEGPDLLARRQPSPYAYSRTPQIALNEKSSETLERSRTKSDRNHSETPASAVKSERQRRPAPANSSSDERQTDDSDLEPAAVTRLRERKGQPRVSFTEPTSTSKQRPEIKRFSSDYTSPTDSRSLPTSNGMAPQKSAMKLSRTPSKSDDEKPSRTTDKVPGSRSRDIPVPTPIPHHVRSESFRNSRPSPYEYPDQDRNGMTHTPPGSPRVGERPIRNDYFGSSRNGSRPNSPTAQNFDARDFASDPPRSVSFSTEEKHGGHDYERRPKNGSDLTSHSRNVSFERPKSLRNDVNPPASALPYPVDDPIVHMPNHEHFIETPVLQSAPPIGRRAFFDEADVNGSPATSPVISKRPVFPPRSDPASTTPIASRDSNNASGRISLPKTLPVCPRTEYSKIYDDWYTLRGDQAFDVCPTCLEGIIRKTPFRLEFIPAPRRAGSVRTRCDFGSPWVRLAWLLTIKRQRQDLDLVYALSAIASVDSSCPDTKEGKGPWYGLLSADGNFIPGFALCSCDTKYIEACFPSLIGLFTRMPSSATGKDAKMCSMRVSGKRFPTYLDLLEDIDEEARTMPINSVPSLQSLIKTVRADAPKTKKCTRDGILRDATWHFIPVLPDFTVCGECFDEVIWPSIKQGSDVAERFNKVLKPLPAGVAVDGASCQVYSTRMRRIWERAVKYGDKDGLNYLARKVRERKEVELDLRLQQKEIGRLLEKVKQKGGSAAATDKERLKRHLDSIAIEWADWE